MIVLNMEQRKKRNETGDGKRVLYVLLAVMKTEVSSCGPILFAMFTAFPLT
jgi:hypothetical protein